MNMIPVSSSNLRAVGYENGTLYVAFHHGGLYSYSGVPESVYNELLAASSKGSYFAAHIKNSYRYAKIG
ncbi:MAG: KTSC domain-containing protein [Eubacteriales bacterium]|nr:KTSC domain-containing protein [Eubacteriales bacterium]